MFLHHRKLLNDSQVLEDSIITLCEPFCDPLGNSDGYCPIPCIPRCYPICSNPIIYEAPPTASEDHQSRSFKLSVFFTVSLAVLATIFLIFALYTAYRFYKVRNRRRRTRTQFPSPQHQDLVPIVREFFVDQGIGPMVDHPIWYIRTIGLPESVISSITTCKYKKSDGLVEGTECSVCLNEFQENESLRLLPKCQHAFHVNCIDTWLRSHTNCPLCRAPIAIAAPQPQPLAPQQNLGTSDQVLEPQMTENRETEVEIRRLSIRVDDDDGDGGNGLNGREDDVGSSVYGVQQLRRSVSMDSLAASALSAAIANAVSMRGDRNSDNRPVESGNASINPKGVFDGSDNKVLSNAVCSSSTETSSNPKGPSALVKRSLSCSAKVFLSRYSRGRSSTPPPQ